MAPSNFKDMSFAQRVYDVVRTIKRGETLTYAQVADRAGSPHASRAVGNVLNKNFDPSIPCHRVVRADGRAGGYNRGAENKERILKREGAIIHKSAHD